MGKRILIGLILCLIGTTALAQKACLLSDEICNFSDYEVGRPECFDGVCTYNVRFPSYEHWSMMKSKNTHLIFSSGPVPNTYEDFCHPGNCNVNITVESRDAWDKLNSAIKFNLDSWSGFDLASIIKELDANLEHLKKGKGENKKFKLLKKEFDVDVESFNSAFLCSQCDGEIRHLTVLKYANKILKNAEQMTNIKKYPKTHDR